MIIEIRDADRADIQPLARIRHEGWHEVWEKLHAGILPDELKANRTLTYFAERLTEDFDRTCVAGPVGAPLGFATIIADELSQVNVANKARGTGVGKALVSDAEARIAAHGTDAAWLKCAIGNQPAIRLYETCGWKKTGKMTLDLRGATSVYPLEVWRFEKKLGADA